LPQVSLIDEELEQLLAVQLEHGTALSIGAVELRVERHIDLRELERMVGAHPLHDRAGFVAQVASGLAVERDLRHPGDAATLLSWTTSS
jgi:hypothetical protein